MILITRIGWILLDKINTWDNYYKYDNLSSRNHGTILYVLIDAWIMYIYILF